MKRQIVILLVVIAFLLVACSPDAVAPVAESVPSSSEAASESVEAPPAVEEEPSDEVPEITATDCLNGEVSPIGLSIAGDYETVSYEQVVNWFCNGAEYEDILVALETETLTDSSAEEMLQMLADGFSWEEIWQLEGLSE